MSGRHSTLDTPRPHCWPPPETCPRGLPCADATPPASQARALGATLTVLPTPRPSLKESCSSSCPSGHHRLTRSPSRVHPLPPSSQSEALGLSRTTSLLRCRPSGGPSQSKSRQNLYSGQQGPTTSPSSSPSPTLPSPTTLALLEEGPDHTKIGPVSGLEGSPPPPEQHASPRTSSGLCWVPSW